MTLQMPAPGAPLLPPSIRKPHGALAPQFSGVIPRNHQTEAQPAAGQPGGFHADPAPHYSWKNVRNAGVVALGLSGWWYGPVDLAVKARDAAVNAQNAIVSVAPAASNVFEPVNQALESGFEVAKGINAEARTWTGVSTGQKWLINFLTWDLLFLAFAAQKGMRQRSISAKEIWGPAHKQGITGKGLTVGVVDSGYRPTRNEKGRSTRFFTPEDLTKEARPKDKVGHGTAVRNIIADGAPDADFVVVGYSTPQQEKAMRKELTALLKAAKQDPDSLTLSAIRKTYAPLIENIANGVIKCVDEGASVINVSLSVEQAVQMQLMINGAFGVADIAEKWIVHKLFGKKDAQSRQAYETDMENLRRYTKRLFKLKEANEDSELISEELRTIYSPWLKALDYAQSKNAMVHLAAGNSGGHKNKKKSAIGNINLLAGWKHPALTVVASTHHNKAISTFTSEFNDDIQPTYAANGSGEISTRIARPERSLLMMLLSPTAGTRNVINRLAKMILGGERNLLGLQAQMKYENPPGTSFASPHSALTHTMMLSSIRQMAERTKVANPNLTLDEIRECMIEAAQAAHFAPRELKKITKEVTTRLKEVQIETNQLHDEFELGVRKVLATGGKTTILNDRLQLKREGGKIVLSCAMADGKQMVTEFNVADVDTEAERDEVVKQLDIFYFAATNPKLLSFQEAQDFAAFARRREVQPTQEEIERELQAEIRRRIGAGTISANTRYAVDLAVQRAAARIAEMQRQAF